MSDPEVDKLNEELKHTQLKIDGLNAIVRPFNNALSELYSSSKNIQRRINDLTYTSGQRVLILSAKMDHRKCTFVVTYVHNNGWFDVDCEHHHRETVRAHMLKRAPMVVYEDNVPF